MKLLAVNEINNSALSPSVQVLNSGAGLAFYIATLWRTVVTLGGIAFILFLVMGGVEWLIAGGDKGKLEEAQKKITNSVIGLGILVGSYAIAFFIEKVFKINILKPVFPNNLI